MVEKQMYIRFEHGLFAEACFGLVSKDNKEVLDMDKLAREHRGPPKELMTELATIVATDCLGLLEYVPKDAVANVTATRQKWLTEPMASIMPLQQQTKVSANVGCLKCVTCCLRQGGLRLVPHLKPARGWRPASTRSLYPA
jgi:hypothetical protein